MFQQVKNIFFRQKRTGDYKALRHTFFRDPAIANQLHEEGYYIADFLGEQAKISLIDLYKTYHQLEEKQDGVFFGTFSKDLDYRKIVHDAINKVLAEAFSKWFIDYKSIINNYVIKTPGKSTRVPIHQDGAAIDEEKYSSINVWIPLQDVTPLNGALSLIPRSQHIFSPYRCNTTPPLVKNIEQELYPYFLPIYLKPGQVIFFDSRVFHYSTPNLSATNRVAIVCRICPVKASIVTYYLEKGKKGASIEVWSCPEDFLISKVGYNEDMRPSGATLIGYKNVNIEPLTIGEFEEKRRTLGIQVQNFFISPPQLEKQNFILEPINGK